MQSGTRKLVVAMAAMVALGAILTGVAVSDQVEAEGGLSLIHI